MPRIVMYKTTVCPFCVKAKSLFARKGVADSIEEIDITTEPHLKDEMMSKADGRKTVPQIFIDDRHIGGCDDLFALDAKGELDALLK